MGNQNSSLKINEEEEVKQKIRQEAEQELKQAARQKVKREVEQEPRQEAEQEVEQEVKQEVQQDIEQEEEQGLEQEVHYDIKQEVERDTSPPVIPKAVAIQEDIKPILTHAAVKRPSSINIESRRHDKRRRPIEVRTATPKPGPSSHPALVPRSLPTTTPVAQATNVSMPASPAPEVMATLDTQQAVPNVYVRRTVGRYIPSDPTLQKAEIARLRAMAERREGQHRDWLERIMKGAEENARSTAQWSWQAEYSHLWTRKSATEGQIEGLENRIVYNDRRIGFAESSKRWFPSHLTQEERQEITNEANTDLTNLNAESDQLRIELAEAKASLITRARELDNLPGPESVGLPPRDLYHISLYVNQ